MFESFILGMVQGIAEWLPISSQAMIVIVKNNFFPSGMMFSEILSYTIFLHIGTLLAAIVYFHKKIWHLLTQLFRYSRAHENEKKEINFIALATLVSGVIGIGLLKIVESYESFFSDSFFINGLVSLLLAVTALLLYLSETQRRLGDTHTPLSLTQGMVTGLFQGLSALPGISRSGSTIAAMGLLGIEKERALELSFILSIPLVIGANIFLNLDLLSSFKVNHMIAIGSSFLFGILTIALLLQLVKKIRFSYFVGIFAFLLFGFSIFEYFFA